MLIDTGSSLTLINSYLLWKLKPQSTQFLEPPSDIKLQLADRSPLYIKYALKVPIIINDSTHEYIVYVVPRLWRNCIIGNNFIKETNMQIDGGNQKVYYKETATNENNRDKQNNINKEHSQQEETNETEQKEPNNNEEETNETEQKEPNNNEEENKPSYILCAVKSTVIPPYHECYLRVEPNVNFQSTINKDDEQYEVNAYRNIKRRKQHNRVPRVANGIISPNDNLIIQVANLSKEEIKIEKGQQLATMSRMSQEQVNAIHYEQNTDDYEPQNKQKEDVSIDLAKTNLNNDQQKRLQKLIEHYPDVFTNKPGRTKKLTHKIQIKDGTRPIQVGPYRCAPKRREIIEENINDMLKEGIITPSKSPWASPVVLAPKKDGTLRFCIDYRKLNAITVKDAYPIPRIDDTLDALEEAKFISTLDLRSGYWQVEMDQKSQGLTAFSSHKGLFEFKVMPYGLMNAPATFQRLMDFVLAGLKWKCCLVYIDDVIIYSKSFDQHLKDLKEVFDALQEANLTLKVSKCHFCREEIKYLGHIITQQGVKPDPELVSAVKDFPQPKNVKDIQAFLGLTGYYRRFIKNYSKIAEPLLKQIRTKQKEHGASHQIEWNIECQKAFTELKEKLINSPIMNTPNFKHPFIIELDASGYGLGAVLAQEYDGQKFVIAYASRILKPAERNYSATEREALAIVWSTEHFRPYIEGMDIFIRTDCQALQWLKESKNVSGRLARWALQLAPFHIKEIKHRPGASNTNADPLSRYPQETSSNEEIFELTEIETAINIWENTNILDEIREEQQKDKKLKQTIDQLTANPTHPLTRNRSPYVLVNGLLYKIRQTNKNQDHRIISNNHLLVIPTSMKDKLIRWAHDHPMAGHAGRIKTTHRLISRVYWVALRRDVYKYVQQCPLCQQFKYDNLPMSMPMQQHIVTEPWHTIGIDLMGPFPMTQKQKQFLLVVVDYFTRWIEVFPLRTTTADVIANVVINEVFCRYGLPTHILSDNGPQFISELFGETCKTLGIHQKFTATYHPQTNMTERVNRTLKQQIRIYAAENHKTWDQEIQKLAFAIRTSVNDTTGETPAFLNFGRDLRIPLDLILGDQTQSTQDLPDKQFIQEYKTHLINKLKTAYHIAREHAEIQKAQQKNKYDRHTTLRSFEVGQRVLVSIPCGQISGQTISNKMQAPYQGPCEITEKISSSTFKVKRLSDNVNLGIINADRLKPFYERSAVNENGEKPTDEVENEAEIVDNTRPRTTDNALLPIIPRASNRTHRVPIRYRD